MKYLDKVKKAWADTRTIADASGCSSMQLAAIDDMSDSEFGARSNRRLHTFWRTEVDRDGDLVLIFERLENDKYLVIVTIAIDRDGIMTVKDHEKDKVYIHDPVESGWNDKDGLLHPMWMVNSDVSAKLSMPCIRYRKVVFHRDPVGVIEIAETGEQLSEVFLWTEVKHLDTTTYWDGPLSGFVRLKKELLYFTLWYEDEVSCDRVYSLHFLTRLDKIKAHLSNAVWSFERFVNRHLPGYGKGGRRWISFPRMNYNALRERPYYMYLLG